MRVVIEALITQRAKKRVRLEANMPDAEALTEKHYELINKALRAKFKGAEIYFIGAHIEDK